VLRRGDSGAEVTELQLRLKQLYLYAGDADGDFDGTLEDSLRAFQWTRGLGKDPKGVYGAETRTALERETSEP
jgi:peptidoglycan hydrolase-like protein with peptidoglycan-binding domain